MNIEENNNSVDESQDIDIIGVTDDDGNEFLFELLDRYESDNGVYVAVTPYFDEAEEIIESDNELIVLKVIEENGEEMLTMIENDDELENIVSVFEERLQDLYEIEPMTPQQ